MGGPLEGLRQVADFLHPRTFAQLGKAGALSPKGPIAALMNLPRLVGRGPSLGILCSMNAVVLGDKPAIIDRNGSLSWKQLDERSNQLAQALEAANVKAGDSIACLLRNGREFVEATFAAQKLGVSTWPLNTWAKTKELKATLESSEAKLLLYDTAHAEAVGESAPQDLRLVAVGDRAKALDDSTDYESWIAAQSSGPLFPFTTNRSSPRVVIQTSGTTGTPKGAARDTSAAGVGAVASVISVVPYRRSDNLFIVSPLFHSFGLLNLVFGTALGTTFVLSDRFDAEDTLRLIEEHRCTIVSCVPVQLRRIVSLDDDIKSKFDVSSLRVVIASGSVLSDDVRKSAIELFGEVLYDLYGSTEAGWVAIATPEDMKRDKSPVGKPVPGIDVAIFDSEGNRLPTNETGELFVKSKVMFEGYTSGESKDERQGYIAIGDLAHLDDHGYLFIEGRADDMVVVGGENVYPVEIEQVIENMSAVHEVAVLGVPDDEYGQILVAFVSGKVSDEDVIAACKKELASYKVPRRVEIMDELPRTTTGKILKRELIETAQED